MTLRDGHVEFGGWIIHLQAAIQGARYGYDAPDSKYDDPAVVYDAVPSADNWVTIDCQLTRVACGHGGTMNQIPGMRADLGRLTADLYDPSRVLDPAASPFALLMTPGAPVRLVAVEPASGTLWPLWTGVAETFEHDLLNGTGRLVASDLVSLFSGVDVSGWLRPDESSLNRLNAVLAVIPEKVPLRFDGTPAPLSSAQFSGNLWGSAIQNTGEAEQSIIWVDQAGVLRRQETQGLGPPVNATDCDDGVTEIIFTALTSVTDDDLLANIVNVERTNLPQNVHRGPLQFSDPESVSWNKPHSVTNLTLPLPDDKTLADWAHRVLSLRSKPNAGISGMAVMVTDAFPWVVREVPQIVRLSVASVLDVRLTSRGQPGRWVVAVSGIRHTIVPDSWDVEIDVVDGPAIVENWGYDAAQSIYDTTIYAAQAGIAGPTLAQIETALVLVLAEEAV